MKTSRKKTFLAGAFMAAVFTFAGPIFGQATRTWVSGVGDDANPGSRTAPCKTFAGCISKTAAGGEIDCLDPGGFGTVTITKSITIDGAGALAGILAAGGGVNGIIINQTAPAPINIVVTLRNLSINGAGTGLNGIRILNAAEVNIENCVISEFTGLGIDINPSAACRVNIKNTVVRGCNTGAVHSHPTAGGVVVTVDKSHFLHSQGGFRATDSTTATISDSVLSGNSGSGVVVGAVAGASRVNVNNCVLSDNGTFGLVAVGALSTVVASNNTISLNGTGLGVLTGGAIISFGNNRNNGNTTNGAPTSTIGQQ